MLVYCMTHISGWAEKNNTPEKRDGEMVTARTEQGTIENLRDAGCDEKTIQDFILAVKQGDEVTKQNILNRHRAGLVHTLNAVKKNIDCLDYLAYQLRKEMDE